MPRNAYQIAVQRNFQKALYRVDMYDGFRIFPLDLAVKPRNVDFEPRLVVDRHSADQRRILVDRADKRSREVLIVLRREPYDFKAVILEPRQYLRHGRVLDSRRHYPFPVRTKPVRSAQKRGIIALGSSRGKYDRSVERSFRPRKRRKNSPLGAGHYLHRRCSQFM